jgi:hypothetical protein
VWVAAPRRTHTTRAALKNKRNQQQKQKPEKDGVRNVCYDLCFKPGGS